MAEMSDIARQVDKPTHTPGPWHYQEGADKYTHIVRTGEISRDNPHVGRKFLCQLAQDTSGESEANARLIAAAPDMLAALQPFVRFLDQYERDCGEEGHIIPWPEYLSDWAWPTEQQMIDARIAIAKATGQSA